MALVRLHSPHKRALPEIGSREPVLGFADQPGVVAAAEKAVVLETTRCAANLGGVKEVAFGIGADDRGGGGRGVVAAQEQKRVFAIAGHKRVRHWRRSGPWVRTVWVVGRRRGVSM